MCISSYLTIIKIRCLHMLIPKVIIGENQTFMGEEELLKSKGVEVVVMDNDTCKSMMKDFIKAQPQLWNEDIGA